MKWCHVRRHIVYIRIGNRPDKPDALIRLRSRFPVPGRARTWRSNLRPGSDRADLALRSSMLDNSTRLDLTRADRSAQSKISSSSLADRSARSMFDSKCPKCSNLKYVKQIRYWRLRNQKCMTTSSISSSILHNEFLFSIVPVDHILPLHCTWHLGHALLYILFESSTLKTFVRSKFSSSSRAKGSARSNSKVPSFEQEIPVRCSTRTRLDSKAISGIGVVSRSDRRSDRSKFKVYPGFIGRIGSCDWSPDIYQWNGICTG